MKKKILMLTIIAAIISGSISFASDGSRPIQRQIYVSVDGSDNSDGSAENPFKTLEKARDEVRKINKDMTGDIIINIGGGIYELEEELRLRPEDSGTNGFNVIYRGLKDDLPTLSGAKQITSSWTEGENGIWTTSVPDAEFIRDLFVNETKTFRARGHKKVTGSEPYRAKNSYFDKSDGFYVDKSKLGLYENPEDISLHWSMLWRDFYIRVEDIIQDPLDENRAIVLMENPVWNSYFGEYAGYDLFPDINIGFIVENAYELLDEPGEFYFNKKTKVLSYIPRENEDMNTADVRYARLDMVLRVEGRDYHHLIQNICFEDVRFAHCTYSLMEESSLGNQQGEVPIIPSTKAASTPASIEVSHAKNISFTSCVFFGMNANCLTFSDAVFDSSVVGCVFTDMGSSAFILGRWYAQDFAPPPDYTRAANVMFRKSWLASYNYVNNAGATMSMISSSTADEFSPGIDNWIWRNEPWAEERGILSWVKADLDDKYTIDSIRVSFEENRSGQKVSEQERSNFEVLVSNDKNFDEYKVVAKYDGVAPKVVTTEGTGTEKYRYVMLRKTVPGPFAITDLKVFSYDREPIGMTSPVKGITFENNYVARTATIHTQAPALLCHSPNSSSVSHNEIHETSYTGISFGWSFDNYRICWLGNNKINHNKIDRAMLQDQDGGGIYMMNWQPDTEYKGNVITNVANPLCGYYFEQGSALMHVKDTVVYNTPHSIFFWSAGNRNNYYKQLGGVTVTNIWSDTLDVNQTSGENWMNLEPIKRYSNTGMPDNVIEIMSNAGLEEKWHYIYDRAPEAEYPLIQGPDTAESNPGVRVAAGNPSPRGERYNATAKSLMDYASFGELPWQYDIECLYQLRYMIERYDAGNKKAGRSRPHILEEYMLRDAVEKTYDSLSHLPLDEMLKMCEDALAGAAEGKVIGSWPKAAIDKFKSDIARAKAMAVNTEYEKALVVDRLEKAYTSFYNDKHAADILYCYAIDCKAEIDKNNRTIKLIVPINTDIKEMKPEFVTSNNAKIAVDLTKLDFSDTVEIPVYSTTAEQYSNWKLMVEREAEQVTSEISLKSENWISKNPNTVVPFMGEGIILQPWHDIYMNRDAFDGKIRFKTKVQYPDVKDGVGYIFSAKSKNLERDGLYDKNTYYELVFKGYTASLQRVNAGVAKEIIKREHVDFVYGDENRIDIDVSSNDSMDIIKIMLNGKTIFNHMTLEPIGAKGFFGVRSANQKVVISK